MKASASAARAHRRIMMRLPVPLVEMIVYALRRLFRDAVDGGEITDARAAHGLGRAKVVEKRPLSRRADALDLIEGIGTDGLGTPRAVGADGEAMRLIAQALDEIEHGIARLQHDGALAAGNMEML